MTTARDLHTAAMLLAERAYLLETNAQKQVQALYRQAIEAERAALEALAQTDENRVTREDWEESVRRMEGRLVGDERSV